MRQISRVTTNKNSKNNRRRTNNLDFGSFDFPINYLAAYRRSLINQRSNQVQKILTTENAFVTSASLISSQMRLDKYRRLFGLSISLISIGVWNESPTWHRITPTAPRASYTGGPNPPRSSTSLSHSYSRETKQLIILAVPSIVTEFGSESNLNCLCSTTTSTQQPETLRSAVQCVNTTTISNNSNLET
ncbi:hypothetical protein KQX54_001080 [Cotesia glomerata]|uniref:Uncharacterized protein n=1 Tax=Cotesia glomerata TaxID=32391 RepID=A0AAV7I5W7_COTGL|nr:hypothetical protein KQX54_001080 [Cotesia glomerata]